MHVPVRYGRDIYKLHYSVGKRFLKKKLQRIDDGIEYNNNKNKRETIYRILSNSGKIVQINFWGIVFLYRARLCII